MHPLYAMTKNAEIHVGMLLQQRYRLLRALGSGGMGTVYLAEDTTEGTYVALKALSTKTAESARDGENRMRREIRVLLSVQSPCVIRLLDWGEDPAVGLFYVMEYLADSLSLRDYITLYSPSFFTRLSLFSDLLIGLADLHHARVIHRDIKSTNALCLLRSSARPHLKLIDPGIARWLEPQQTQITVETHPNAILGTPAYMPPEMWTKAQIDERTDIYQAGILGYEMIAGLLPFAGTPFQLMHDHLYADLPKLSEQKTVCNALFSSFGSIDPTPSFLLTFDQILAKATEKEPEDRYQDAQSMQQDILQLLSLFLPSESDALGIKHLSGIVETHDLTNAEKHDITSPSKLTEQRQTTDADIGERQSIRANPLSPRKLFSQWRHWMLLLFGIGFGWLGLYALFFSKRTVYERTTPSFPSAKVSSVKSTPSPSLRRTSSHPPTLPRSATSRRFPSPKRARMPFSVRLSPPRKPAIRAPDVEDTL